MGVMVYSYIPPFEASPTVQDSAELQCPASGGPLWLNRLHLGQGLKETHLSTHRPLSSSFLWFMFRIL